VILAADLGGTQSRLLLAEQQGDRLQPLRQTTLPSRHYPNVEALLEDFLQPGEKPDCACLAAAGPVTGNCIELTNLPWQLDAVRIAQQFGIPRVQLLNDFTAQTYALPYLQPHQLLTLQAGTADAQGTCALIGAGTGLGMALLCGDPLQPLALPSQGGHADFAPQDEQQIELLRYLLPEYGRVSLELLLSGRGITRLYAFLGRMPLNHPDLPDAHTISLAADAGEALADATLRLFARLYGAAAGNLALTSMASGGVFLSGGIAPKMLPYLQQPDVLAAFCHKGPMQSLLESMALNVVLDEHLGLQGAARLAARLERAAGEAP
jgi:glucokinase